MKICDLCTKEGVALEPLKSDYATEDVKEVCGDCVYVINKHLTKTQSMAANIVTSIVRRFITEKKSKS